MFERRPLGPAWTKFAPITLSSIWDNTMTRITVVAFLGWLLLTSPALSAGETKARLLVELWDAAYLQAGRAGLVHTTVHEIDRNGQKHRLTTVDLQLNLKRNNEVIQ